MNAEATIEIEFRRGVFQASFDGQEWRAKDASILQICENVTALLPFAYHPDPVNEIAAAVAKRLGGRVLIEAEPPAPAVAGRVY